MTAHFRPVATRGPRRNFSNFPNQASRFLRKPMRHISSNNRLHATVTQELVERLGELRVSIMNEIALAQQEAIAVIGQLPGTLHHERLVWIGADPGDVYAPRAELHHEPDIIRHQSMPGSDLDGEEVRRDEHLPVHLEEFRPTRPCLSSLGRRVDVMATQDVTHGNLVDVMPEVGQRTLDTLIPPTGVLLSHAHDELLDLLGNARSSKLFALLAAVKLPGNQLLIPSHEGGGRRERGELF